MLTRLSDWPSLLDVFLVANLNRRFAYGSWDCCLFACDAIEAMIGVDPAVAYRGLYSDRKSAMGAVRRRTGAASVKSVAESVTTEYGMPPVGLMHAGRGDLVLLKRGSDWSLGIVALNGRDIVVAAALGLVHVPIASGTRAWKV